MQFKRTRIPYTGRDKYFNGTGRKVKKSSILYGFGGSGGGTGIHPLQVNPSTASTVDAEVTVPATNINASDLTIDSGITVTIPINGYADNELTEVWIGTTNSADTHYGISGMPANGMTVHVDDNGTDEPKLLVTFYSNISQQSGELLIPIQIKNATYMENWGITQASWDDMSRQSKTTARVVSYTWNIKSAGGGSGYIFDLTNENATVNADTGGTIYSASVATLQCQAILYYDSIPASGVNYSISLPAGTTGVSINQSTGVLTFSPTAFTFTGMATNITVTAVKEGITMNKVMRITKVKDGAGGASTSRWILPSVYSVVQSIDGTVSPSAVSATVMVQVAGNAAEVDTATTIYYGFAPGNINPTIPMPSTGVVIDSSVEYLVLALREGNVYNGTVYESETIPMICEGTGPAIRGPIRWSSNLARRFSNGVGDLISDRDFVDIIRYNTHTYRCITSYTQVTGSTWASVSSNWELDDRYRFIASSIDLDANEAIAIRATNEIDLTNASNQTTGKINNTSIMLGTTDPSTAPVYLNNQGLVRSTTVNARSAMYSPTYQSDFVGDRTVKAMMCPFQMQVMLCTDDKTLFTVDNDMWYFNGMSTEIDANEYPYVRTCERETDADWEGWWIASDSERADENERYVVIGVASSNSPRKSDIIYLTI